MAEVFKKISDKVVGVAKLTKNKVKEFSTNAKLNIELKGKEADLDACFEKLGRAYFAQASASMNNSEKIEALMTEAKLLSGEILELKQSIAEAQGKKICEHCASIVDADAPYCEACGQKVVAEKRKEQSPLEEEKTEE